MQDPALLIGRGTVACKKIPEDKTLRHKVFMVTTFPQTSCTFLIALNVHYYRNFWLSIVFWDFILFSVKQDSSVKERDVFYSVKLSRTEFC